MAGRLKAVGDWINKALDADPERVAQVVAKMTDSQINATLEVIDSMEMGKIRHLEQLLIENLSDNKQSK